MCQYKQNLAPFLDACFNTGCLNSTLSIYESNENQILLKSVKDNNVKIVKNNF